MRLVYILLAMLVLVSCGTSRKKWVQENCNNDGAFLLGTKDGKSNRLSGLDAMRLKCPKDSFSDAETAYMNGFKSVGGVIPAEEKVEPGQDFLKDAVKLFDDEGKPSEEDGASKSSDKKN